MKHTDPAACLSCDLLKFIRDSNPTEAELLAWLSDDGAAGRFHVLRKAGLLRINNGRVELSSEHLSKNGTCFAFGSKIYIIDDDQILITKCEH